MDRSVYDSGNSWGFFSESSGSTPSFHALKKAGVRLPMHDYLWTRFDAKGNVYDSYNGFVSQRNAMGFSTFRDALLSANITCSAGNVSVRCKGLSEIENILKNRLLQKVRDSQVDLGVALGETRETAAFIASAMSKAAIGYRQLRRGDISSAVSTMTGRHNDLWRDIPGVAANSWLAYAYGLRPLVNDVYSAARALERSRRPISDVKTVRASEYGTLSGVAEFKPNHATRYSVTCRGGVACRGAVTFRVTNPVLRTLDQCGVVNPLSVAWELVPFSFVVDWFIPVGRFITEIVPPQGVDFVDGYISSKATGSSRNTCDIEGNASDARGWHTYAESVERYKKRTVLSSFPRYSLIVPDLSLSYQQITSGIALLGQALENGLSPGKPHHTRGGARIF